MTYSLIWEPKVVDVAASYLAHDPEGLRTLFAAVDGLAVDPRPEGVFALGTLDVFRLRVGSYRVVYDVDDEELLVRIRHVGRRS